MKITNDTLLTDIDLRFFKGMPAVSVQNALDHPYVVRAFWAHGQDFHDSTTELKQCLRKVVRDLRPFTGTRASRKSLIVPLFPTACTGARLQCAGMTVEQFYAENRSASYFEWVLREICSKEELERYYRNGVWNLYSVHLLRALKQQVSLQHFIRLINRYLKRRSLDANN